MIRTCLSPFIVFFWQYVVCCLPFTIYATLFWDNLNSNYLMRLSEDPIQAILLANNVLWFGALGAVVFYGAPNADNIFSLQIGTIFYPVFFTLLGVSIVWIMSGKLKWLIIMLLIASSVSPLFLWLVNEHGFGDWPKIVYIPI